MARRKRKDTSPADSLLRRTTARANERLDTQSVGQPDLQPQMRQRMRGVGTLVPQRGTVRFKPRGIPQELLRVPRAAAAPPAAPAARRAAPAAAPRADRVQQTLTKRPTESFYEFNKRQRRAPMVAAPVAAPKKRFLDRAAVEDIKARIGAAATDETRVQTLKDIHSEYGAEADRLPGVKQLAHRVRADRPAREERARLAHEKVRLDKEKAAATTAKELRAEEVKRMAHFEKEAQTELDYGDEAAAIKTIQEAEAYEWKTPLVGTLKAMIERVRSEKTLVEPEEDKDRPYSQRVAAEKELEERIFGNLEPRPAIAEEETDDDFQDRVDDWLDRKEKRTKAGRVWKPIAKYFTWTDAGHPAGVEGLPRSRFEAPSPSQQALEDVVEGADGRAGLRSTWEDFRQKYMTGENPWTLQETKDAFYRTIRGNDILEDAWKVIDKKDADRRAKEPIPVEEPAVEEGGPPPARPTTPAPAKEARPGYRSTLQGDELPENDYITAEEIEADEDEFRGYPTGASLEEAKRDLAESREQFPENQYFITENPDSPGRYFIMGAPKAPEAEPAPETEDERRDRVSQELEGIGSEYNPEVTLDKNEEFLERSVSVGKWMDAEAARQTEEREVYDAILEKNVGEEGQVGAWLRYQAASTDEEYRQSLQNAGYIPADTGEYTTHPSTLAKSNLKERIARDLKSGTLVQKIEAAKARTIIRVADRWQSGKAGYPESASMAYEAFLADEMAKITPRKHLIARMLNKYVIDVVVKPLMQVATANVAERARIVSDSVEEATAEDAQGMEAALDRITQDPVGGGVMYGLHGANALLKAVYGLGRGLVAQLGPVQKSEAKVDMEAELAELTPAYSRGEEFALRGAGFAAFLTKMAILGKITGGDAVSGIPVSPGVATVQRMIQMELASDEPGAGSGALMAMALGYGTYLKNLKPESMKLAWGITSGEAAAFAAMAKAEGGNIYDMVFSAAIPITFQGLATFKNIRSRVEAAKTAEQMNRILVEHYKPAVDILKKVMRQAEVQYHPDRNPGNPAAEAQFKVLQPAYDAAAEAFRAGKPTKIPSWATDVIRAVYKGQAVSAEARTAALSRGRALPAPGAAPTKAVKPVEKPVARRKPKKPTPTPKKAPTPVKPSPERKPSAPVAKKEQPVTLKKLNADPGLADSVLKRPKIHPKTVIARAEEIKAAPPAELPTAPVEPVAEVAPPEPVKPTIIEPRLMTWDELRGDIDRQSERVLAEVEKPGRRSRNAKRRLARLQDEFRRREKEAARLTFMPVEGETAELFEPGVALKVARKMKPQEQGELLRPGVWDLPKPAPEAPGQKLIPMKPTAASEQLESYFSGLNRGMNELGLREAELMEIGDQRTIEEETELASVREGLQGLSAEASEVSARLAAAEVLKVPKQKVAKGETSGKLKYWYSSGEMPGHADALLTLNKTGVSMEGQSISATDVKDAIRRGEISRRWIRKTGTPLDELADEMRTAGVMEQDVASWEGLKAFGRGAAVAAEAARIPREQQVEAYYEQKGTGGLVISGGLVPAPPEAVTAAIKRAGESAQKLWRKVVDLPGGLLKRLPTDSPLGRLRDTVGSSISDTYGRPPSWVVAKRRAAAQDRLTRIRAGRRADAYQNALKRAGYDADNPTVMRRIEGALRGDLDLSELSNPERAYVEQTRALIDAESLAAADILEKAGLSDLAKTYRENVGRYLMNIPRKRTIGKGGVRQYFARLTSPRLTKGFRKPKRDAWMLYDGKKLVGKFAEETEARRAHHALILQKKEALITKKGVKKGVSPADLYRRGAGSVRLKPPISEEWREEHEIHDPRYLVASTLFKIRHNAEMVKLFTYAAKKWGKPAPKGLNEEEEAAWAKENGLVRLPKSGQLHNLKGMYVPKVMASDLTEMTRVAGTLRKIWRTYLSAWKAAKVIDNPPTWVRNVLGEFAFSYLDRNAPWNPANFGHYWQAIQSIKAQDDHFMFAVSEGLIGTEFFGTEIRPIEVKVREGGPTRLGSVLASLKVAQNTLGRGYSLIDQISKMAGYFHHLADGMSQARAARETNRWHPNYGETSRLTRILGKSPIGAPFISFIDQSVRIAGRAARDRPVRLATIMMLPAMLTYMATLILGMSDDEKRLIDTNRTYWEPIMPFRDEYGRVMTLDMRYIMPLGNDIFPEYRRGVVSMPWIFSGPAPTVIGEQMFGKERFTGREFLREDMTAGEQAKARALQFGKAAVPYPSILYWGPKRIYGSVEGYRREQTALAILGVTLGVNIRSPYIAERDVKRIVKQVLKDGDPKMGQEILRIWNEAYKPENLKPLKLESLRRGVKTSFEYRRRRALKTASMLLSRGNREGAQKELDRYKEEYPEAPPLAMGSVEAYTRKAGKVATPEERATELVSFRVRTYLDAKVRWAQTGEKPEEAFAGQWVKLKAEFPRASRVRRDLRKKMIASWRTKYTRARKDKDIDKKNEARRVLKKVFGARP